MSLNKLTPPHLSTRDQVRNVTTIFPNFGNVPVRDLHTATFAIIRLIRPTPSQSSYTIVAAVIHTPTQPNPIHKIWEMDPVDPPESSETALIQFFDDVDNITSTRMIPNGAEDRIAAYVINHNPRGFV